MFQQPAVVFLFIAAFWWMKSSPGFCLMASKVSSLVRWGRSAYMDAPFPSSFTNYVPVHTPVTYPKSLYMV
jgi:hypothetical protein